MSTPGAPSRLNTVFLGLISTSLVILTGLTACQTLRPARTIAAAPAAASNSFDPAAGTATTAPQDGAQATAAPAASAAGSGGSPSDPAVDPAADPVPGASGAPAGGAPASGAPAAAASRKPSTAATRPAGAASASAAPAENTAPYLAAMKQRAVTFRSAMAKITSDANAANANRLNPTWPFTLSDDADAVSAAAAQVAAVKPPASLAAADAAIDAAAGKVAAGAEAFKSGVGNLSASEGEAGYKQMTAGEASLNAALAKIGV